MRYWAYREDHALRAVVGFVDMDAMKAECSVLSDTTSRHGRLDAQVGLLCLLGMRAGRVLRADCPVGWRVLLFSHVGFEPYALVPPCLRMVYDRR